MGGKLGLLFLLARVVVASGSVVSLSIKAVHLGGWLVVEGWMTNLFQGVDMGYALMDGTRVTLWSAMQGMFLSAVGGSGSGVVANQGEAKDWETLRDHWKTFITEEDFRFISSNGLNAVRIPVAWWITKTDDTPSCHPPNYPGYQAMLDRAFQWAEKYNLGVIGDLHAAPWSQNGQSHSSSRDGTVGWGDQKIDETVRVIEGLAARYAAKKSLLRIGLLNEPSEQVHIDTLKKYYKAGYNAVRNQVKGDDVYVIMEGRLAGGGDSKMADFTGQFRN
ncbi:hypothetical protein ZWY2020_056300 [Hordeum vulgare]|nr:hypothetical protein ZWY2020_056300 [Hordeum vulgare]